MALELRQNLIQSLLIRSYKQLRSWYFIVSGPGDIIFDFTKYIFASHLNRSPVLCHNVHRFQTYFRWKPPWLNFIIIEQFYSFISLDVLVSFLNLMFPPIQSHFTHTQWNVNFHNSWTFHLAYFLLYYLMILQSPTYNVYFFQGISILIFQFNYGMSMIIAPLLFT